MLDTPWRFKPNTGCAFMWIIVPYRGTLGLCTHAGLMSSTARMVGSTSPIQILLFLTLFSLLETHQCKARSRWNLRITSG